MQSIYDFIVKPKDSKRYNNTKSIGGVDLIISTSEEDFRFANREAIVIAVPVAYDGPIREGDTLIVHHNAFKIYNDMKGRRKSGKSFFRDDKFFIDIDQFFAYRHEGERVWHGHDRYCFVKPIPAEETYIYKPVTHEPLVGEVTIVNDGLRAHGISVGDRIGFKPESEYEFTIDGQLMYRLFDHAVTLVL